MANHFYSTGYFIPKAPTSFTHTPVTRAFAAMLQTLSAYIDSERDLEHIDSFDPAVDNWVADAERNRVAMFAALDRLRDTRLTRALDVPLRRMGVGLSGWSTKLPMSPLVSYHASSKYDCLAPVFWPSTTSSRSM